MVDVISAEEIVRNIAAPFGESVNFFLTHVVYYAVSSKKRILRFDLWHAA